jgi:hypothetical protein
MLEINLTLKSLAFIALRNNVMGARLFCAQKNEVDQTCSPRISTLYSNEYLNIERKKI